VTRPVPRCRPLTRRRVPGRGRASRREDAAVKVRPRVAWDLTITHGRIVHIDMLAGDSLDMLDLAVLDD
jgi:hypothetical protein